MVGRFGFTGGDNGDWLHGQLRSIWGGLRWDFSEDLALGLVQVALQTKPFLFVPELV